MPESMSRGGCRGRERGVTTIRPNADAQTRRKFTCANGFVSPNHGPTLISSEFQFSLKFRSTVGVSFKRGKNMGPRQNR